MTSVWSLIFILSALALNTLFLFGEEETRPYKNALWASGGPFGVEADSGAFLGFSSYYASPAGGEVLYENTFDGSSVLAPSSPLTNVVPIRGGLKKYKVQAGDTLSALAANFGISVETIRFANPGLRSYLKVGEEIVILPVSGILYEVKDGDSLEIVANRYQIAPAAVKRYNPEYQKLFERPGSQVILPYAKPLSGVDYANRYVRGLPDLGNYFSLPARGWNWGQLHDYNAVDIADQCGSPVYAAAEGLVTEASTDGSWNQGYGNQIIVEHPNGTRTRYAHLAKALVRTGDYVTQGDRIALIGNTGNTHGPTGCHLHFEVYGAKNPFAVR